MRPIRLTTLAEDEIAAIHEATLRVLSGVGVRVANSELRALLAQAGALVDEERGVVRLPAPLVEGALASAPRQFVLRNRLGEALPVPAPESYICARLLLPRVLDYGAEAPREPVMADVARFCQVANTIPDVQVVLRTDTPVSDVEGPADLNNLLTIQSALSHTAKHFLFIPLNYESAVDWIAMGEAATEGGDLSSDPIMTVEVSTTAPLVLDSDSARILLLAARKGVPTMAMPMPAGGGTAPLTVAGELVQMNAEALFIITAAQMVRPGLPCFYGGIPCTFDLRTSIISLSSPEFPLMTAASLEMARHYGLPVISATKYTDSLGFDEQAGAEKIMAVFASQAGRSDILYGCGDLDNAYVLSAEQVLIDVDLTLAARRMVQGVAVDPERLAVEAIERVGPGGHYLSDRHTVQWLRRGERLVPRTYNRLGHRSAARSQLDKAHEIVQSIWSAPAQPVAGEAARARMEAYVRQRREESLRTAAAADR